VVGDITMAGKRPITTGGMVADQITMMLVGAVDGRGSVKTPLVGCRVKGCKSALRNGLFATLDDMNRPCIALGDFDEFPDSAPEVMAKLSFATARRPLRGISRLSRGSI
jgi:hypothetical protein